MRSPAAAWMGTAFACAVALTAMGAPAHADSLEAAARRPVLPSRDVLEWHELHLGRAAMEQSLGNPRGVIESLEALDLSEPSFPEADRAAFLLGQAYLSVRSAERFVKLAHSVSRWKRASPYTEWLSFQLRLAETDGTARPPASPDSLGGAGSDSLGGVGSDSLIAAHALGNVAADALAASLLLQRGQPEAALRLLERIQARPDSSVLVIALRVLALEATGQDDEAALERLATADTATTLGRELSAAANLRRAARALASGKDPSWLLDAVPGTSRYHSRARHMQGLAALESGAVEQGVQILEALRADDSAYVARRDVSLEIAGRRLDAGQWLAAQDSYREIDEDWTAHRQFLQRMLAEGRLDELWSSWEAGVPLSDALVLDALPARMLAERNANAAADLVSKPPPEDVPPLDAPLSSPVLRWPVAAPPVESRRAVAASAGRVGDATDALVRSRRALEAERAWIQKRLRYLEAGLRHARHEQDTLAARAGVLDSLFRTLEGLDARIRAVRDEASRRVVRRAREVRDAADRHLCWLQAMRHFYIDGPNAAWAVAAPPGFPSRDSLALVEETLASALRSFAERVAQGGPDLIERSYQHAWRPHLIERAAANRAQAHRLVAWIRELGPSLQAGLAAAATSPGLAGLETNVRLRASAADSARAAHATLRARVAREAVEQALAVLETEREPIDYGLAASAYGLSVLDTAPPDPSDTAFGEPSAEAHLTSRGPRRSAPAPLVIRPQPPARDSANTADTGEDLDDPGAVAWRGRAIEAMKTFLDRYPRSPARGEMRFRLADLLFVDARHSFRERMARYTREQSEGRNPGPLPVMSQAPALNLYRAILTEDRDNFPHLDAVLFNAGMLLADQGDPEAQRFFAELVTTYPASRYGQEASLKMGDLHFDEGRFAECVPLYQRAAEGSDATLQAIALYKMGWAQFNGERLPEAADAFRSVLDLYGSHGSRIEVDVEGEAETYLVHTLARAGGVRAFAEHFDRAGSRPYERRVLRDLGLHFRRYSLFAEAAAVEELYLDRYPLDADAPVGAQRLADTYQRWDRPELARKARLEYGLRFAPASPWAKAQTSDSVRAAGADFARASWKSVALDHHRDARARGAKEDWREALRLYQMLLSHWPEDPDAPAYQLYAGEASARLGEYGTALTHLSAAMQAGTDSITQQAAFQRVAVTDAWYENTRATAAKGSAPLPPDSLARAVLAAGDEMLARFPEHAAVHDVLWRQGNVALAHGWLERAAQDFERLATRFPEDERAPVAAGLRADALFRMGRFEAAGAAFEAAQQVAHRAGHDSLERRAAAAVPVCYYRHAESVASADSNDVARHAPLFEQVAARWPRYEHAHLAQYRAGLAYLKAGKARQGVAAMESLIQRFPASEYVKDAHLQICKAWEASGEPEKAAQAYAVFAERYPKDASAAAAWLKAGDLFTSAGQTKQAEEVRLGYIRKFPDDVEAAAEILESLARQDLATVGPQRPISALLPRPAAPPRSTKRSPKRPAPAPVSAPSTHLGEYLQRMEKHPKLVSKELLAQVRYLQGEEAQTAYAAARLTQPLEKSIPIKQKLLDSLIAPYRRSVDLGASEWAIAAAFRIGEALVSFGEALEESERPADLKGDDLLAYGEVLREQAQAFYDRGEGVWTDLLRQNRGGGAVNPWIAKAQAALWQRLGERFSGRPEVDYPLVGADPPERQKPQKEGAAPAPSRDSSDSAKTSVKREGHDR